MRSFLNISPMSWGVLMIALFVIAFPVYAFSRNRPRTRHRTNGFFIATVALGTIVVLFLGAGIFTALWRAE